ncbi:MAG: helix-turn-helix domain-containing protein [Bacteroidota bacterium]
MEFNWVDLILIIGMTFGFTVSLVIRFFTFFRNSANQYFAYSLMLVALIGLLFEFSKLFEDNVWIIVTSDIMWEYLFPVTFLYYFLHAMKHPLLTNSKLRLLYLPFLVTFAVNILLDLGMDLGVYDLNMDQNEPLINTYYFFEYTLSIVFSISIFIWIFFLIQQFKKSEVDPQKSKWFLQFWTMSMVLLSFWMFSFLIALKYDVDLVQLLFGGVAMLFFWVSYQGIYKLQLLDDQNEIKQLLKKEEKNIPQPTALSDQILAPNIYLEKLERLLVEEHVYRKPDLNREYIANRLGISSGYLSQLLNSYHPAGFSDYINTYRVADVKRMITHSDFNQYSLVAIGLEAGFNSKSSFYAVFKKMTGLTPTAFKQANKASIMLQTV